jgi:hypothetical protein
MNWATKSGATIAVAYDEMIDILIRILREVFKSRSSTHKAVEIPVRVYASASAPESLSALQSVTATTCQLVSTTLR